MTGVLKDCMGSLGCHATMLAHVSPEPAHYSETLHTLQLAARIHRYIVFFLFWSWTNSSFTHLLTYYIAKPSIEPYD